MALTESKLRNIKAPYTDKSEIFDRDGLTARISKTGVIVFYFRFQWIGKSQRMKLGRYPEIKLTEAREQVIKLRRAVFEGNDPRHLIGVLTITVRFQLMKMKNRRLASY